MVGASDKYMSRLFRGGKAMFLAYDQGLEHGPKDFNDRNFDPSYVIDIALRHRFTGLILHKGLAEQYRRELFREGAADREGQRQGQRREGFALLARSSVPWTTLSGSAPTRWATRSTWAPRTKAGPWRTSGRCRNAPTTTGCPSSAGCTRGGNSCPTIRTRLSWLTLRGSAWSWARTY